MSFRSRSLQTASWWQIGGRWESQGALPLHVLDTALRAVRVFRPLRVVTGIPEIRIIVNSLLYSFRMLLDVLMLYLLMLITFGIVALTLWRGKLRYLCPEPYPSVDRPSFCSRSTIACGVVDTEGCTH